MRLDIFTEIYAWKYDSRGDACLHLFVYKCLLAQSHLQTQNLGSPGFVCIKCVYGCIIKDFKHLILRVFCSCCAQKIPQLLRVNGSSSKCFSLCCSLFVKLLSFLPLSLSLSPSLPASALPSLPPSLWDSRQERNWSGLPWEACLCVWIGRIPWVPRPSMQCSWREMQCWSRG